MLTTHKSRLTISSRVSALSLLAFMLLFTTCASPCAAFATYRMFGGAVHKQIIYSGLNSYGLTKRALKQLTAGCNAQDNPAGPNFSVARMHSCDNEIEKTHQFIETELFDCVDLAGRSRQDKTATARLLFKLGTALHALQDFYSHSNYLERLLSDKQPLEPFDWQSHRPNTIVTCYYHYESFLKQEFFESRPKIVAGLLRQHPDLRFHSEEEFRIRCAKNCSEKEALDYALSPVAFTHLELNKDTARMLEGRMISGAHQKSYHQLARELAARDTARFWQKFEQLVKEKYGQEADKIINAIKTMNSNV